MKKLHVNHGVGLSITFENVTGWETTEPHEGGRLRVYKNNDTEPYAVFNNWNHLIYEK